MKKKIILICIVCMVIFQHSFSFVQAATSQTPDICGAASDEMILYQNFQKEIASLLLGGSLGEQIFKEELKVVGLFTTKTLHLPTASNSALDAALLSLRNNILRLGSASVTTFILLIITSSSVAVSNLEGLAILFQDRAVVRDWRSLLQIDTKLTQIAYYLGKTVNLYSSIDVDASARLQDIFLAYQSEGLFTGVATTSYGNISYLDILLDVSLMNASMKVFLSANNTDLLSMYKANNLFEAKFTTGVIAQLSEDYAVVRGFSPCNPVFNRLNTSIKQSFSSNAAAAKDSRTIIADASKRLTEAFAKTTGITTKKQKETIAQQYFSEYELQQLRTVYGINTVKMTKKDAVQWKNILGVVPTIKNTVNETMGVAKSGLEVAKTTVKTIISTGKGFIDWLKEMRKTRKKAQEQKKSEKNTSTGTSSTAAGLKAPQISVNTVRDGSNFEALLLSDSERNQLMLELGTLYNTNFDDALHSAFSSSLETTLALYGASSADFVSAEVTSWTPLFYTLVNQVQEAEEKIGTLNGKGLKKHVATICEKQCANKGTDACWI